MERRLKFAVVREDPELERTLIQQRGYRSALLVASGGCTALALRALHPELELAAFDLNPHQLAHVETKRAAIAAGELARLNVGDADPAGLNQCGAFEGLFRILRGAIAELVTSPAALERFFAAESGERRTLLATWSSSPYWPAVFATAFNDRLLHAMFGPDATQHAAPGSYPGYFQRVFERGLGREDAAANPFLQHVLLGRYLEAPAYCGRPLGAIELIHGSLPDVPELQRFELYSLSNVFDWSDDAQIARWAEVILRAARPGSAVLIRQLNNTRDVRRFFAPAFLFDDALGRALVEADRSLFYEKIEVGFRVA